MRWFLPTVFLLNLHLAAIAATIIPKQQPLTGRVLPKAKAAPVLPPSAFLSTTYYLKSCPNLESIIQQKVNAWVQKDSTLAASIIRLHFHDCAIRVFNSTSADILTAAARDATLLVGGPFWEVPFGRKDGKISIAKEANNVPQGHENVTSLLNFFDKMGLTFVDLVVLSGAHTIGRCTCYSIQQRLYNFNGTGKPDPSLNINYLNSLRKQCRLSSNYVNLDVTTPKTFDVAYYTNLAQKLGLLSTDQLLYSDSRTGSLVNLMASQPDFFIGQFAVSMVKLGNTNVLTGKNQGEVRQNCNYVNY
ncbi:Peroxidase 7 [Sesamum angolense]|uniref:Peroxidase n=1 Tax=Sesamum angolense TaxID=2727404 RepID=A0AAE2BV09_9LAMI|nr:Peroxidase 7 [Sesamum angolense]